jgi:Fasciclin domain
MKLSRTSCLLWLATLVSHGWAISLLQVLQTYPQLSSLYSLVNSSASATALLANTNNFTFLAPSNDAVSKFNTQNPGVLNGTQLLPILQYGLLKGGYPTLSITTTPQFIQSNLSDSTYANVTGGQAVELVLGSDGTPEAVTGNRSISTSSGSVSSKNPLFRISADPGKGYSLRRWHRPYNQLRPLDPSPYSDGDHKYVLSDLLLPLPDRFGNYET